MCTRPSVLRNGSLSSCQQILLSVLSGLLLSIPFLEAAYYQFSWVAFVPLLFAIKDAGISRSYYLGMLSGLTFSVSAGYWIVNFLMLSKGYSFVLSIFWALIFWLYSAQLNALVAALFNSLRRGSNVHEFIIFPVVVTSLYSLFPMLFPVRLGDSQSSFLFAIQAAEFTGVNGIDAIIALSNIVLFRLTCLLFRVPNSRQFIGSICLSAAAIFAWFAYGLVSIERWNSLMEQSSLVRIGIVQPNEAPSLESAKSYPGFSRAYPPEMAMTERLAKAGAELVVWPEAKYKAYSDRADVRSAYRHQLDEIGTRLVFQDIANTATSGVNAKGLKYNTALMLNTDGSLVGDYQKMKRIPFGEYVPLVSDIRVLRQWVENFFGKFLNEIAAGNSHQLFNDERFSIIPLICYEVMFPEFVASAVTHANSLEPNAELELQKPSLLVGLSSNGWFGDTRQPYQHVNASILRAVENRTPLVHAVNNGPSIVALPSGQVIFKSDYHKAGGYIVDIPEIGSDNLSFFTQYPRLFLFVIYGALIGIVISCLGRFRQKARH